MTDHPLVSVIIPTYNRASLIEKSVKSVYSQTYSNIELIVVDDGSEDDTERILSSYIDKNGLVFHKHKENRGAPAARNTGGNLAHGEFLAFLDSDDKWDPRKLEKQVQIFNTSSPDVALVYTGIKKINEKGDFLGNKIPVMKGYIFNDLLIDNCIGSTSVAMIRRDAFLSVGGFDEKFPARQDLDLWLRIARDYAVDYIAEPLVEYLVHSDRISVNLDSRLEGCKMLLEKYKEDIYADKEALFWQFYTLGRTYYLNRNWKEAIDFLRKAIRVKIRLRIIYYLMKAYMQLALR